MRFNFLRLKQRKSEEDCEWIPRFSIRSLLRVLKTKLHGRPQLEPENDSSVVPEVALVVVATTKAIAESSQHKIKLCRPNGDRFGQWDVDSSSNNEIPSIVARSQGTCARAWIHA
jgi:hypothetical protein